ncbi:MAG: type I-E CRISPR-associated protein Cas5/CasD [Holophaga sp.]|nr:type I-E CRISPR-associated protein Cas5/CasD [Holophaga sp.]
MATLLVRLEGPMQSWGTTSRFDQRDTGREPSKSGVVGLLAAALGIDRDNWTDLAPLAALAMGVRHDRPGIPRRDYQTAGCAKDATIIRADGSQARDGGVVSERFYLADAAFLVGLEGSDGDLLVRAQAALRNPAWPLALGRKSYVPSAPIWLADGLQETSCLDALRTRPWLGTPRRGETRPLSLLLSREAKDGTGLLKMDQPLASFAERRFGARFIQTEWIPNPEVANVPA